MTVAGESTTIATPTPGARASETAIDRIGVPGWVQAVPFALVFVAFFIIPLIFVAIVSFWDYNDLR
jgi:ABC-type sugar transport system permease subunit